MTEDLEQIDAVNDVMAEDNAILSDEIAENDTNSLDKIEDSETEREPEPWETAPEGMVYYEKIYDDGHLGSFTNSAETAYKFGWFENSLKEEDIKQSDINGWWYLADNCPMKTESDIAKDEARAKIAELKKYLTDTDYQAIKYAEGRLTDAEYETISAKRQDARNEINRLEATL